MDFIPGTGGGDTLSTNEDNVIIDGAGGNDSLTGGDGSVTLLGGLGDDTLVGGAGGGLLNGGDGDDTIKVGDGDAVVYAGSGNNTIEVSGGGNATIFLEAGTNTVDASEGSGTVTIVSSGGDNTIELGGGDAILQLGGGNDAVTAGSGNVTMAGGGGDDTFVGGDGEMFVDGGDGNDTITFGNGGGVASGGGGNNTYVIGPEGAGDVSLLDFDPATDVLDLSQFPGAPSFGDDGNGGTTITIGGITVNVPGVAPSDVEGATETNPDAPCFLRGTRILTPEGEVAVEDLRIGDLVVTLDGSAKPLKWIGRRSHAARFLARAPKITPVCFRAGSLGDTVPSRDLYVSHDHAMFVDGVFVDASQLCNGVNVVRAFPGGRSVDYFHLEFETHAIVFAHGAPSESYVNHDNRAMFQNASEFEALYGADAPAAALPEGGHERSHRAVKAGAELEAIRARIVARAEQAEDLRRVA